MPDSVPRVHAVQVSKQGIGEVGCVGCVARNMQRHGTQFVSITADEVLPGAFVSRGAGARENQFFEAQSATEIGGFVRGGLGQVLTLNVAQDGCKLLAIHPISRSSAAFVQRESLFVYE